MLLYWSELIHTFMLVCGFIYCWENNHVNIHVNLFKVNITPLLQLGIRCFRVCLCYAHEAVACSLDGYNIIKNAAPNVLPLQVAVFVLIHFLSEIFCLFISMQQEIIKLDSWWEDQIYIIETHLLVKTGKLITISFCIMKLWMFALGGCVFWCIHAFTVAVYI